jgi:hypothetical protein
LEPGDRRAPERVGGKGDAIGEEVVEVGGAKVTLEGHGLPIAQGRGGSKSAFQSACELALSSMEDRTLRSMARLMERVEDLKAFPALFGAPGAVEPPADLLMERRS